MFDMPSNVADSSCPENKESPPRAVAKHGTAEVEALPPRFLEPEAVLSYERTAPGFELEAVPCYVTVDLYWISCLR